MSNTRRLRVLHTAVSMNPSLGVIKQMEWEQAAADALGLPWKVVLHTPSGADSRIIYPTGVLPRGVLLRYFVLRKNFHEWLMQVEQDYDVIVLRHSVHDLLEARTAAKLGHKLLTMHHTLEGPELRAHGLLGPLRAAIEQWVGKKILHRSLGLVAVTHEIKSYEQDRDRSSLIKPSFVYPNGVWLKSDDISDLRSDLPEFLFVASYFSNWHGLDLLIEAVEQSKSVFRIHLVGTLSSVDAARCAKDKRFVIHNILGTDDLTNLMNSVWCGLSSFALHRKGMQEACSLKVREYLNSGVAVYAAHRDAGLPDDFPYFKQGPVNIDEMLCFANKVRFVSRATILTEAAPHISKILITGRIYEDMQTQLAPILLGDCPSKQTIAASAFDTIVLPKRLIAMTGGSGFIGKSLIPALLAKGWLVRVLSRDRKNWVGYEGIDVFEGDLTSTEDWSHFVHGADILIHAASEIRNHSLMDEVNVEGPKKLLEAALAAGVGRWVQLSSVGAYGPLRSGWVDELTPENPANLYEKTKTKFDQHLRKVSAETGLQICIVRPSNVYGPNMNNQSLFKMMRVIANRFFVYVGPSGASANYVHVDDVVSALVLCATKPEAAGETYNVSDWTTVENMVRSMSCALSVQPPHHRLPTWLAVLFARTFQWASRWPLTVARVHALSNRVRYSSAKIEHDLGWRVSVPVVRGVRDLVESAVASQRKSPVRSITTKLRKVLIVTYDWPPRNSIATHRPYSWARHWSAEGWDVTVLTATKKNFDLPLDLDLPKLDGVKVMHVDYKALIPMSNTTHSNLAPVFTDVFKKVKSAISYFLGWEFDVRSSWAGAANRSVKDLGTDFAVVVSTYGPDSAHKIAASFKQANPSIFWVADYRDLWSLNARSRGSPLFKLVTQRQELKTVRSADMFTTVSDGLASDLYTLTQKWPAVIYNGFDIELDPCRFDTLPQLKKGAPVHVLYTGRIYPGKRNPLALIRAIEYLIDAGQITRGQVCVDFYGVNTNLIDAEIGIIKYPEIVKQHGYVPRSRALELQQSADLLLMLESGDNDSKGFLTGKIFEYIAAGRPIIGIGSTDDSAIAMVLSETRCGRCYGNDIHAIAADLLEYVHGRLPAWYRPDLNSIKRFSRKYQSEKLMQKINEQMALNATEM
jgi:nucleoside-diphosphate-sugar epimerase/glycosyltransferase involved in cell wall biosynthesis